jgi:hypothetical protein
MLILFLVSAALSSSNLAGQNGNSGSGTTRDLSAYEGRPRVTAVRLGNGETISVDGRLEEPVWKLAIPATNFMQQDPNLGQPATERTEVRFAFSRTALYLGVICFDSEPDNLKGNTKQRDGNLGADDRFMWAFDPYLDGRSGYAFEMNPSGAMVDNLISPSDTIGFGAGGGGGAWDGIWYGRVETSNTGWTIEIEIPFRTLNFDPNSPAWGLNFQRTIRRKNEETLWTGWARNQGLRRMANAGLLEGISDVSQGVGLDVQPYLTGNYVDATGRNLGTKFEKDTGVDLIYSITPQLKANFTVNTDFAETEVDQRRVNLTRFPLFFPERRGFFLEGSNFFDFSREQGNAIRPFFSRRIGLDDDGHPQRIDFGTKIAGQIGANDIGLLHVRTAASDGLIGEDFSVFRAKRRFFLQSYAGMLYTRRDERDTDTSSRQLMGADFQLATSRFRGSQNLNMSGFYLWNTKSIPGKRGTYGIRVDYPNDLLDLRMAFREVPDGYDPAVGFVDRLGVRRWNPDLIFAPRPRNSRVIRRFIFRVDDEVFTDLDNRLNSRITTITPLNIEFQSGDTVQFHIMPYYELLERNFEISPGVRLPIGTEYNFTRYRYQVQTANRRVVSVNTLYERGAFYSGNRRDFTVNLGLRPRPGVNVNLNNEWNRIELPEGKFSTKVLRLNANTQFSPWISLVNNVQFDSVTRVLGWQLRFRWILRPGNDIHFVYLQNWLDDPVRGRYTLDRSVATKLVYTHRF